MTISAGDRLPQAELLRIGEKGPEKVGVSALTEGRKVVIFGLPGAYTGTCTSAHVPSFMRNVEALKAKGVDEIVCVSVNDPFVMKAWGEATGGTAAGITFVGDPLSEFTKAIGLNFSNPNVGFTDRSRRYALAAEDGVVTVLHIEESPGVCDRSGGEAMVAAL